MAASTLMDRLQEWRQVNWVAAALNMHDTLTEKAQTALGPVGEVPFVRALLRSIAVGTALATAALAIYVVCSLAIGFAIFVLAEMMVISGALVVYFVFWVIMSVVLTYCTATGFVVLGFARTANRLVQRFMAFVSDQSQPLKGPMTRHASQQVPSSTDLAKQD